MEDETPWWKKPWVWIVAAIGVVGSILAFIFTLGRRKRVTVPKPQDLVAPPKPELEDVKVPEREKLNTTPKDDYDEDKTDGEDIKDAISSVNSRFK
jgi:hypothetical protein